MIVGQLEGTSIDPTLIHSVNTQTRLIILIEKVFFLISEAFQCKMQSVDSDSWPVGGLLFKGWAPPVVLKSLNRNLFSEFLKIGRKDHSGQHSSLNAAWWTGRTMDFGRA